MRYNYVCMKKSNITPIEFSVKKDNKAEYLAYNAQSRRLREGGPTEGRTNG